jgi:hypothetical protein
MLSIYYYQNPSLKILMWTFLVNRVLKTPQDKLLFVVKKSNFSQEDIDDLNSLGYSTDEATLIYAREETPTYYYY